MNPERVLAVAARIEAAPAHKFNMRDYFLDLKTGNNLVGCAVDVNACSTAACVAGWTNITRGADGIWSGPWQESLWLELNEFQENALFYPPGFRRETVMRKQFTKSRAIAVLRHLAETDKVEWRRFDTRGRKIQ